jgi:hypothetical protein
MSLSDELINKFEGKEKDNGDGTHSKVTTVKRAAIKARNGDVFYYMIEEKDSGDGWNAWQEYKGYLGTKKNTYSWTTKWIEKQNDCWGEILDEIKRRTEGKEKKSEK